MSVDKFGRTSAEEGSRGPPGEGFSLTEDGNYDIQGKALRNVASPAQRGDAVNLDFINNNTISAKGNTFSAGGKVIENVGRPVNETDAINKKYYFDFIPISRVGYWDFFNKRLVRVNDPVDPQDVVNKRFMDELLKTKLDPLSKDISEVKKNQSTDTVARDEFERKLKSFGVHLFRHIHRPEGRSADTEPPNDENTYLNWEEILK